MHTKKKKETVLPITTEILKQISQEILNLIYEIKSIVKRSNQITQVRFYDKNN